MSPPSPLPAEPACLNCGQPLQLPRPRFCNACGQETNVQPPTLREFAQQFGGAFLSTEGALWRTFKLLLLKPGELTRQYLAGRRKHYVLPLRLYLTISVLVLLAVRLVTTISIQSPGAVQMDNAEAGNFTISLGTGSAGMRKGVFFCEQLPDWLCHRIQRRIDVKPEGMVDLARQMGERFVGNLGGAMFVLLPSLALFFQLAYLNRRLRYTEHLVFALHLHAFWFLMLGVGMLSWAWVTGLAFVAVPVYTLLAMRRVFGGRWWALTLRAGFVTTLYLLMLVVALSSVAVWSLLA